MGHIRVLHVDDEPAFGGLVVEFLERENPQLDVTTVTRPRQALDRLDEGFDCVVSDYQMPETNGLEFLDEVRASNFDLPFILFTGKGSEEIASEAISRGVTDYLQKETGTDQYTVLANRIANVVERYRSTSALAEREESLARAQQIANLGNWDWTLDTDGLFWSDQIYRIFGVDPESFEETYEAFLGFVHPDDRSDVQAAVDAALAGDETYDVEHRIVRSDGEERIVHEQAEVVRDDEGDPTVMRGTVQDVTDRVERRRELDRYERIVEAIENGIFVLDADRRFELVNEQAATAFGIPRRRLEDEPLSVLAEYGPLDGSAASAIEDAIDALAGDGRDVVHLTVTAGGSTDHRPLELRLNRVRSSDGNDLVIGILGDSS